MVWDNTRANKVEEKLLLAAFIRQPTSKYRANNEAQQTTKQRFKQTKHILQMLDVITVIPAVSGGKLVDEVVAHAAWTASCWGSDWHGLHAPQASGYLEEEGSFARIVRAQKSP